MVKFRHVSLCTYIGKELPSYIFRCIHVFMYQEQTKASGKLSKITVPYKFSFLKVIRLNVSQLPLSLSKATT